MLRAVRFVNPATPTGLIAPSVPPAIITSASPYWIARNASPIQCVPDAQAVTTLVHFPLAPRAMDTFPAAILLIILGTRRGSTFEGPRWISLWSAASIAGRLPIPEPTITPTRKGSSFSISIPASAIASFDAATAYWENNSIRLAALKSI